MTFGDLWSLIEKARVSTDLRIVYLGGRFGSPTSRVTIYNGEDPIINVPKGEIPIDKQVFIWDDRYSGAAALREGIPCAGTVLKRLLDGKLIKATPRINALIHMSRNIEKVTLIKEDGEVIVETSDRNELNASIHTQVQRDKGYIPV